MKKVLLSLALALSLCMGSSQAIPATTPNQAQLERAALATLENLSKQDLALLENYIKQMPDKQLVVLGENLEKVVGNFEKTFYLWNKRTAAGGAPSILGVEGFLAAIPLILLVFVLTVLARHNFFMKLKETPLYKRRR